MRHVMHSKTKYVYRRMYNAKLESGCATVWELEGVPKTGSRRDKYSPCATIKLLRIGSN